MTNLEQQIEKIRKSKDTGRFFLSFWGIKLIKIYRTYDGYIVVNMYKFLLLDEEPSLERVNEDELLGAVSRVIKSFIHDMREGIKMNKLKNK